MTDAFMTWGASVIEAAATLLEAEIAGAWRGKPRRLRDRKEIHLHFQDAHLPQPLAVWLYATAAGGAYNIRGYPDIIGVGLKHDAGEELDRIVWKFRRLALFTWHKHVDDRWEGLRWICKAGDLPADPQAAARAIVERVLPALRRAGAVPDAP